MSDRFEANPDGSNMGAYIQQFLLGPPSPNLTDAGRPAAPLQNANVLAPSVGNLVSQNAETPSINHLPRMHANDATAQTPQPFFRLGTPSSKTQTFQRENESAAAVLPANPLGVAMPSNSANQQAFSNLLPNGNTASISPTISLLSENKSFLLYAKIHPLLKKFGKLAKMHNEIGDQSPPQPAGTSQPLSYADFAAAARGGGGGGGLGEQEDESEEDERESNVDLNSIAFKKKTVGLWRRTQEGQSISRMISVRAEALRSPAGGSDFVIRLAHLRDHQKKEEESEITMTKLLHHAQRAKSVQLKADAVIVEIGYALNAGQRSLMRKLFANRAVGKKGAEGNGAEDETFTYPSRLSFELFVDKEMPHKPTTGRSENFISQTSSVDDESKQNIEACLRIKIPPLEEDISKDIPAYWETLIGVFAFPLRLHLDLVFGEGLLCLVSQHEAPVDQSDFSSSRRHPLSLILRDADGTLVRLTRSTFQAAQSCNEESTLSTQSPPPPSNTAASSGGFPFSFRANAPSISASEAPAVPVSTTPQTAAATVNSFGQTFSPNPQPQKFSFGSKNQNDGGVPVFGLGRSSLVVSESSNLTATILRPSTGRERVSTSPPNMFSVAADLVFIVASELNGQAKRELIKSALAPQSNPACPHQNSNGENGNAPFVFLSSPLTLLVTPFGPHDVTEECNAFFSRNESNACKSACPPTSAYCNGSPPLDGRPSISHDDDDDSVNSVRLIKRPDYSPTSSLTYESLRRSVFVYRHGWEPNGNTTIQEHISEAPNETDPHGIRSLWMPGSFFPPSIASKSAAASQAQQRLNPIHLLFPDILTEIFSYLTPSSLVSVSAVSKRLALMLWYGVVTDEDLNDVGSCHNEPSTVFTERNDDDADSTIRPLQTSLHSAHRLGLSQRLSSTKTVHDRERYSLSTSSAPSLTSPVASSTAKYYLERWVHRGDDPIVNTLANCAPSPRIVLPSKRTRECITSTSASAIRLKQNEDKNDNDNESGVVLSEAKEVETVSDLYHNGCLVVHPANAFVSYDEVTLSASETLTAREEPKPAGFFSPFVSASPAPSVEWSSLNATKKTHLTDLSTLLCCALCEDYDKTPVVDEHEAEQKVSSARTLSSRRYAHELYLHESPRHLASLIWQYESHQRHFSTFIPPWYAAALHAQTISASKKILAESREAKPSKDIIHTKGAAVRSCPMVASIAPRPSEVLPLNARKFQELVVHCASRKREREHESEGCLTDFAFDAQDSDDHFNCFASRIIRQTLTDASRGRNDDVHVSNTITETLVKAMAYSRRSIERVPRPVSGFAVAPWPVRDVRQLRLGAKLDVLDTVKKWYVSTIIAIDTGDGQVIGPQSTSHGTIHFGTSAADSVAHGKPRIRVHFDGWGDRWDEWIPVFCTKEDISQQPRGGRPMQLRVGGGPLNRRLDRLTTLPSNPNAESNTAPSLAPWPISDISQLSFGMQILALDTANVWLLATIISVEPASVSAAGRDRIQLTYNGWSSRWDEWIDLVEPHENASNALTLAAAVAFERERSLQEASAKSAGVGCMPDGSFPNPRVAPLYTYTSVTSPEFDSNLYHQRLLTEGGPAQMPKSYHSHAHLHTPFGDGREKESAANMQKIQDTQNVQDEVSSHAELRALLGSLAHGASFSLLTDDKREEIKAKLCRSLDAYIKTFNNKTAHTAASPSSHYMRTEMRPFAILASPSDGASSGHSNRNAFLKLIFDNICSSDPHFATPKIDWTSTSLSNLYSSGTFHNMFEGTLALRNLTMKLFPHILGSEEDHLVPNASVIHNSAHSSEVFLDAKKGLDANDPLFESQFIFKNKLLDWLLDRDHTKSNGAVSENKSSEPPMSENTAVEDGRVIGLEDFCKGPSVDIPRTGAEVGPPKCIITKFALEILIPPHTPDVKYEYTQDRMVAHGALTQEWCCQGTHHKDENNMSNGSTLKLTATGKAVSEDGCASLSLGGGPCYYCQAEPHESGRPLTERVAETHASPSSPCDADCLIPLSAFPRYARVVLVMKVCPRKQKKSDCAVSPQQEEDQDPFSSDVFGVAVIRYGRDKDSHGLI